jgi:hypothetical protein
MTDLTSSFSYAVVRVGPVWKVVGARRAMGRFATCELALTAAGNLAREAFVAGHRAEVLLQSESGELTVLPLG